MTYSTIIVKINNKWRYNLTALGEFAVVNGSTIFKAVSMKNSVCFDSVFNVGNKILYPWIGPCLDNITLIKI